VSAFAALRPDGWNLPLFLHVFGAMILVGGLLTSASALAFAKGELKSLRLGYWSLLAVAIPGWVLMRIGAEWIYSREGWDDLAEGVDDPGWLATGAIIGDIGGLTLLVSLIVGGFGVYRLREGRAQARSRRPWYSRSSSWPHTWSPSGRWPRSRIAGLTGTCGHVPGGLKPLLQRGEALPGELAGESEQKLLQMGGFLAGLESCHGH
jgi:hypothetical protein